MQDSSQQGRRLPLGYMMTSSVESKRMLDEGFTRTWQSTLCQAKEPEQEARRMRVVTREGPDERAWA